MSEDKGLKGTVKWFSNRKGFGFIASDALKEEIFVHQTGIVTNGQFRTLQESSKVKFDVEKEEGSGKLKAVNVTNEDGTPIAPPPRQPRRVRTANAPKKEGGGDNTAAPAEKTDGAGEKTDEEHDTKDTTTNNKKPRKPRNGRNKQKKTDTDGAAEPAADKKDDANNNKAPKDPPFHAILTADVKKQVETDRKLTLGNRTTIDVALGPDARIKLGQGGYTALCLKTAVIGEGTFTCDASGTITFSWQRAIECKDGAWKSCSPESLLKSFSLVDEKVAPVGDHETAATLWGGEKPNPKDAFESNGFQMRRVVLTRPTGRFRRGGGGGGGGGGGRGGGRNNNRGKKTESNE